MWIVHKKKRATASRQLTGFIKPILFHHQENKTNAITTGKYQSRVNSGLTEVELRDKLKGLFSDHRTINSVVRAYRQSGRIKSDRPVAKTKELVVKPERIKHPVLKVKGDRPFFKTAYSFAERPVGTRNRDSVDIESIKRKCTDKLLQLNISAKTREDIEECRKMERVIELANNNFMVKKGAFSMIDLFGSNE
jgi:hypothetical protein